ncbi:hypothetical protein ABBQ38_010158 [Trebouxia sp. C0009 RCD-2024]
MSVLHCSRIGNSHHIVGASDIYSSSTCRDDYSAAAEVAAVDVISNHDVLVAVPYPFSMWNWPVLGEDAYPQPSIMSHDSHHRVTVGTFTAQIFRHGGLP